MRKRPTSLRLTELARELMVLLSRKKGVSQSDVVEIALRELAERERVSTKERERE